MLVRFIVLTFVPFIFFGCASTYTGPKPDYSLRGEAATTEIEKFKLSEGYFNQGDNLFGMGPTKKLYKQKSILPIIEEVSPEAISRIQNAKSWRTAGWLAWAIAVGVLVSEFSDSDNTITNDELFWGALGSSIVLNSVSYYKRAEATEVFNRDLRQKFNPSVSYNYTF